MGRTVIILDLAHHGTTMLAGIIHLLGIPMITDADFDKMKGEDPHVIRALQEGYEAFGKLVQERNQQFEAWGFKRTGAWKYESAICHPALRDPVYMSIWKDPVSVTRRRFKSPNKRLAHKLRDTIKQMHESVEGVYGLGVPVIAFSYYHAIQTPGVFIRQVGQAIGIEPSYAQVARIGQWIQPNIEGNRRRYPLIKEHYD